MALSPTDISKLYASVRQNDLPRELEGRTGSNNVVADYRARLEADGNYDSRSDSELTLALGDHYRMAEDFTVEDQNPHFSDDYLDLDLKRADSGMLSEFGGGLESASRGMVGSLSGAYGMTGMPGHESAWEWGIDVQTNSPRASVRRVEDIWRNNGLSMEALSQYAPNAVGQVIPSLVEGIAAFFIGSATAGTGAVALYGAKTAATQAAKVGVKAAMKKSLRKSMAAKMRKKPMMYQAGHSKVAEGIKQAGDLMDIEDYASSLWKMRGGIGATTLNSLALNGGEVYNSLREEGFSHDESQLSALAYGSMAAAPDTILPAWVGRTFLKKSGMLGQSTEAKSGAMAWFGKTVKKLKDSTPASIGLGVLGEGSTEAFQELTNIAAVAHAKGEDVEWNDATKSRMLNASVLGAIGGGIAGIMVGRQGKADDDLATNLPGDHQDFYDDYYGPEYTNGPEAALGDAPMPEGTFVVYTGANGDQQLGRIKSQGITEQNLRITNIEPAIGMDFSGPIPMPTEFGPEITVETTRVIGTPRLSDLQELSSQAKDEVIDPNAVGPVVIPEAVAPDLGDAFDIAGVTLDDVLAGKTNKEGIKKLWNGTPSQRLNVIHKYLYDQLRLPGTSKYGFTKDAGDVTGADNADSRVFGHTDENNPGWYYRFLLEDGYAENGVRKLRGGFPKTTDRISLNVDYSPELIKKLDAWLRDLNLEGANYKTPKEGDAWSDRRDPITIYLSRELTAKEEASLVEATKDSIRRDENMDSMSGVKISDGVFKEDSPTHEALAEMITRAEAVSPELAAYLREDFNLKEQVKDADGITVLKQQYLKDGTTKKLKTSAGMVVAAEQMIASMEGGVQIPIEQAVEVIEEASGETSNEASEEVSPLAKQLMEFLSQFGIEVEQANALFIDLASKNIKLDTSNPDQVAAALAKPLSRMLAFSDHYYEIRKQLLKSKKFKERYKNWAKGKKVHPKAKAKVERTIITGQLEYLLRSEFSERVAKDMGLDHSALQKIKDFITKVLEYIKGADIAEVRRIVNDIVDKTIEGKDFIRTSANPRGTPTKDGGWIEENGTEYVLVDFQKAFDDNEQASDVLNIMADNDDFILTGSIAFSTQGTIYRPAGGDVVHDLDFSNKGTREEGASFMEKMFPGAWLMNSYEQKVRHVDTYLVPPAGFKVGNAKYGGTKTHPKLLSYSVYNAAGAEVGKFTANPEAGTASGFEADKAKSEGEALLVDVFSYKAKRDILKRRTQTHSFVNKKGETKAVTLMGFESGFEAKLQFNRFKDIYDFNRFIPNRGATKSTEEIVSEPEAESVQLPLEEAQSEKNDVDGWKTTTETRKTKVGDIEVKKSTKTMLDSDGDTVEVELTWYNGEFHRATAWVIVDGKRDFKNKYSLGDPYPGVKEGDLSAMDAQLERTGYVAPTSENLEKLQRAIRENEAKKKPKEAKKKPKEAENKARAEVDRAEKALAKTLIDGKAPSSAKTRKGKITRKRRKYESQVTKVEEAQKVLAGILGKPEPETKFQDTFEEEQAVVKLSAAEKKLVGTEEEFKQGLAHYSESYWKEQDKEFQEGAKKWHAKKKLQEAWTSQKSQERAKKSGVDSSANDSGDTTVKSGGEETVITYPMLELVADLRDSDEYAGRVKKLYEDADLTSVGTTYAKVVTSVKEAFPEINAKSEGLADPDFWTTVVVDELLEKLEASKNLGTSGNLKPGDINLRNLALRNNFAKPHHNLVVEHGEDGVPESRQWVWVTTKGHRGLKESSLKQQIKVSNPVSASTPHAAMLKLRAKAKTPDAKSWETATDSNAVEQQGLLVMRYGNDERVRKDYMIHRSLGPASRRSSFAAVDLHDGRGKRQVAYIVTRSAPDKNGKTTDMVRTHSGRKIKLKYPTGQIVGDPLSVEVPTPDHLIPIVIKKGAKDPEYAGVHAGFPDGIDVGGMSAAEIETTLKRVSKGGTGKAMNLLSKSGSRYLTRAAVILTDEDGNVYMSGLTDHTKSGDKGIPQMSDGLMAHGLGVQNFARGSGKTRKVEPRLGKNNTPALLQDVINAGFKPIKVIRVGKIFSAFGDTGQQNRSVDTLAGYINTKTWSTMEDFDGWFDEVATVEGKIRKTLQRTGGATFTRNIESIPFILSKLLSGKVGLGDTRRFSLRKVLEEISANFDFNSGTELSRITPIIEAGAKDVLGAIHDIVSPDVTIPLTWDVLYEEMSEASKYDYSVEDALIDRRDEFIDEIQDAEDEKGGEGLGKIEFPEKPEDTDQSAQKNGPWKDRLAESDYRILADSGKMEMYTQYMQMSNMLNRSSSEPGRQILPGYVEKFRAKMEEIAEELGGHDAIEAITKRGQRSRNRLPDAPISQKKTADTAKKFNQVIGRLLQSGVDIDIFRKDMESAEGFLRAEGARIDETSSIIQLVVEELMSPGTTNLLGVMHESVHFVLDKLPAGLRQDLLDAVDKSNQQFAEKHLDRRRASNLMLNAKDKKKMAEYLSDPEELLIASIERNLVEGSLVTRGVIADLVRKLKEIFLRIAVAIGKSTSVMSDEMVAEVARKYLQNRMRQWLAVDNAISPPLLDVMRGPQWTPGEKAGVLREIRDPHAIPDFLDMASRQNMRNIEITPSSPMAIKVNSANAIDPTAQRYTQEVPAGTNAPMWADAAKAFPTPSVRAIAEYTEDPVLNGLLRDVEKMGLKDPELVILSNAKMRDAFPGKVAAYRASPSPSTDLAFERVPPTIYLSRDFSFATQPENETENALYLLSQRAALAELVGHELTHHITDSVFEAMAMKTGAVNPRWKKASTQAFSDWVALLDFVRKNAGSKREMIYGLTSVQEFISEWRNNPEFQSYLKSIPLPEALADKFKIKGKVWDALKLATGRVTTPTRSAHSMAGVLFGKAVELGAKAKARPRINPTAEINNPAITGGERLIFGNEAMQIHGMLEGIPRVQTKLTLTEAMEIPIHEEVEIDGEMVPAHYVETGEEAVEWGDRSLVPGQRYFLAYPRSPENKFPPPSEAYHPHQILAEENTPPANEMMWRIYRTPSFIKYFGDWTIGHRGVKGEDELPFGEVQYLRNGTTNEPKMVWTALQVADEGTKPPMHKIGSQTDREGKSATNPSGVRNYSDFSQDLIQATATGVRQGYGGDDASYGFFATTEAASHLAWKMGSFSSGEGKLFYTALSQRYMLSYLQTLQAASKSGTLTLPAEYNVSRKHAMGNVSGDYTPTPLHLTSYLWTNNENLSEAEKYNVPTAMLDWKTSSGGTVEGVKRTIKDSVIGRVFYVPGEHHAFVGEPRRFTADFSNTELVDQDLHSDPHAPNDDSAIWDAEQTGFVSEMEGTEEYGAIAIEGANGDLNYFKFTRDPIQIQDFLKDVSGDALPLENIPNYHPAANALYLKAKSESKTSEELAAQGMDVDFEADPDGRDWMSSWQLQPQVNDQIQQYLVPITAEQFGKHTAKLARELEARIPEVLEVAERVLLEKEQDLSFAEVPSVKTWEDASARTGVPAHAIMAKNNVEGAITDKIDRVRFDDTITIPRDHDGDRSLYTEGRTVPLYPGGRNPFVINDDASPGLTYPGHSYEYVMGHMLANRLPLFTPSSLESVYNETFNLANMWNLSGQQSQYFNTENDGSLASYSSPENFDVWAGVRLPTMGLPSAVAQEGNPYMSLPNQATEFRVRIVDGEETNILSISEETLNRKLFASTEVGHGLAIPGSVATSDGKETQQSAEMTEFLAEPEVLGILEETKLPSGRDSSEMMMYFIDALRTSDMQWRADHPQTPVDRDGAAINQRREIQKEVMNSATSELFRNGYSRADIAAALGIWSFYSEASGGSVDMSPHDAFGLDANYARPSDFITAKKINVFKYDLVRAAKLAGISPGKVWRAVKLMKRMEGYVPDYSRGGKGGTIYGTSLKDDRQKLQGKWEEKLDGVGALVENNPNLSDTRYFSPNKQYDEAAERASQQMPVIEDNSKEAFMNHADVFTIGKNLFRIRKMSQQEASEQVYGSILLNLAGVLNPPKSLLEIVGESGAIEYAVVEPVGLQPPAAKGKMLANTLLWEKPAEWLGVDITSIDVNAYDIQVLPVGSGSGSVSPLKISLYEGDTRISPSKGSLGRETTPETQKASAAMVNNIPDSYLRKARVDAGYHVQLGGDSVEVGADKVRFTYTNILSSDKEATLNLGDLLSGTKDHPPVGIDATLLRSHTLDESQMVDEGMALVKLYQNGETVNEMNTARIEAYSKAKKESLNALADAWADAAEPQVILPGEQENVHHTPGIPVQTPDGVGLLVSVTDGEAFVFVVPTDTLSEYEGTASENNTGLLSYFEYYDVDALKLTEESFSHFKTLSSQRATLLTEKLTVIADTRAAAQDKLKFVGHLQGGSSGNPEIWTMPNGEKIVRKIYANPNSRMPNNDEVKATGEVVASQIASYLTDGLTPAAQMVERKTESNPQGGGTNEQPFVEDFTGFEKDPTMGNYWREMDINHQIPSALKDKGVILDLLKHLVADFVINNRDTHAGNYGMSGGRVVAIDKGQAFKYNEAIGRDRFEGDYREFMSTTPSAMREEGFQHFIEHQYDWGSANPRLIYPLLRDMISMEGLVTIDEVIEALRPVIARSEKLSEHMITRDSGKLVDPYTTAANLTKSSQDNFAEEIAERAEDMTSKVEDLITYLFGEVVEIAGEPSSVASMVFDPGDMSANQKGTMSWDDLLEQKRQATGVLQAEAGDQKTFQETLDLLLNRSGRVDNYRRQVAALAQTGTRSARSLLDAEFDFDMIIDRRAADVADGEQVALPFAGSHTGYGVKTPFSDAFATEGPAAHYWKYRLGTGDDLTSDPIIARANAYDGTQAAANNMLLETIREAFGEASRKGYGGTFDQFLKTYFKINPVTNLLSIAERDPEIADSRLSDFDGNAPMTDRTLRFSGELHSTTVNGVIRKKQNLEQNLERKLDEIEEAAETISSLSEQWRDATVQEAEAQKAIRSLIKEYVRGMDGQVDMTFVQGKLLGSIEEVEMVLRGEDLSTVYKDTFERLYDGDISVFDYVQAMAETGIDYSSASETEIATAIGASVNPTLKKLTGNKPLLSTLIAFAKDKALQMALLEARTTRDISESKEIDGELKRVARMSVEQLKDLKRGMKGIRKQVSKVYKVRDEYAKVRLKYKKKQKQAEKAKVSIKTAESILKTLRPRQEELHVRLGAGYNFRAVPGEKYYIMQKLKGVWAATEAVYSVAGTDKNRADISNAKYWNKAYLAEQATLGKQDLPFNKMLADMTLGISRAVVHREYRAVHMNLLDRKLGTLEQRWRSLGQSGVQIARQIAHFRQIQTQYQNESRKLAGHWDGAMSEAIIASGMDKDIFKDLVYDTGIYWIENMPEYGDNPDLLYREVHKMTEKTYRDLGKAVPPALEGAMRKLWSITEKASGFEDEIANGHNILVEDPSIQWSNPMTGKKENLLRRRIKYGRITIPRRMKGEVIATINEVMRDAGWRDKSIWAEVNRLGATSLNPEEAYQGIIDIGKKLIPEVVHGLFLDPLLTKPGDPIFKGPQRRGSKARHPIPQDEVATVWADSGNDLGVFIRELYLNQEGADPTELPNFAAQVIGRLRSVYEMTAKVAEKVDTDPLNPNGQHPHRMMDARTNTIFPREWLEYDTYTKVDMGIHISKLASVAAFGRDSSILQGMMVATKSSAHANRLPMAAITADPSYLALTTDKQRKKFIEAKLGKETAENAAKSQRIAEEVDDLAKDMRDLFTAPGGGFKDMRGMEEAIGLNADLILRTPKSGLWSVMSGMDYAQRMGYGSLSGKASANMIWNSVKNAFGSFFGEDGIGLLNLRANETAKAINYLRSQPGQQDLSYRELFANNGVRGSASTAIKYMRGAQSGMDRSVKALFGRHKDTGKSGYAAFTPFSPFSWLNNVFGSAVAESMVSNWRTVVTRAMAFMDSNPAVMTDPNFKFTLRNLGIRGGILGGNTRALEYMEDAWAERHGESFLDLCKRCWRRKAAGQEIFTKKDFLGMYQMSQDDINLEGGIGSTPVSYRTNGILRAASPLLRWATAKTNSVHKSLQTQEGRFSTASVFKGMAGIACYTMPIGIAASLLMDEYDEEILGKKSNLREVDPTNLLPGFAMYGMLTNRDGQGLGILERLARAGNTYGLGMEAIYGMTAWTDPNQGQRSLGVDRILMYSQLSNARDSLVNILHSGWYMNYEDGKRLFDTLLGQAPSHLAQTVNNVFGPVHEGERRRVKRVDAYNYVRSAGRAAGLPLDKGGIRSSPTPLTARIRQMMLAAYGDDPEEFNNVLQSAMEAATSMGHDDPMVPIVRSWKQRDPMDLFTRTLTDMEQDLLFSHMTERGEGNVRDLMRLHEKYLRYLAPSSGASSSRSKPYRTDYGRTAEANRLRALGL